jgi:hypothetical protein
MWYNTIMTNLRFMPRNLDLHQQIDLQLRQIVKEGNKPTLIRLSNQASVRYVREITARWEKISTGPKCHLLHGKCLVEISYNEPVKWFEIDSS